MQRRKTCSLLLVPLRAVRPDLTGTYGGPVSRDTTFALYYIEKLGDAARCGVISFGRPSSSYRLFSFYRHSCRTYPSSALSSCPLPSHPYRPSFSRLFLLPALLCSRNARRKC